MGTAGEWLRVLISGALWGAFMSWWEIRIEIASLPRRERVLRRALWALMGLWFGVVTTFGWRRSFQYPLVCVTVGLLVGTLLVARLSRKHPSLTSDGG